MIEIMFAAGAICLLFGAVYPLCAIMFYPFYRMMGGETKFFKYMRNL